MFPYAAGDPYATRFCIDMVSLARRQVISKAVKHADSTALGDREDLLSDLRAIEGLVAEARHLLPALEGVPAFH
jgi:hypothetical protein